MNAIIIGQCDVQGINAFAFDLAWYPPAKRAIFSFGIFQEIESAIAGRRKQMTVMCIQFYAGAIIPAIAYCMWWPFELCSLSVGARWHSIGPNGGHSTFVVLYSGPIHPLSNGVQLLPTSCFSHSTFITTDNDDVHPTERPPG